MFWDTKDLRKVPVEKVMTKNPTTVSADHHLVTAKKLMVQNDIRHLPVVEAGALYGVISDRDVKLADSVYALHKDKEVKVKDICLAEVYAVPVGSNLKDILDEMIQKKYGCVVVTEQEKVVGIFTLFDAAKILSGYLR